MTLGQMNRTGTLLSITHTKDAEGFSTVVETAVATFRVYREGRHGSKMWANLASFGDVTDLFRFRVIPGVSVTTDNVLTCDGERFEILSVEDIRGAGMYLEVLAKKVVPTVG